MVVVMGVLTDSLLWLASGWTGLAITGAHPGHTHHGYTHATGLQYVLIQGFYFRFNLLVDLNWVVVFLAVPELKELLYPGLVSYDIMDNL